jgi:glyoxylase-like metal-dependent hydrolase (beta-lactamase superfamily II)
MEAANHSDAILAFATEKKRPIAAIINTHWQLDHPSGNGGVKAAHPQARVYTTSAIDKDPPGGFLAIWKMRRTRAEHDRCGAPRRDSDLHHGNGNEKRCCPTCH